MSTGFVHALTSALVEFISLHDYTRFNLETYPTTGLRATVEPYRSERCGCRRVAVRVEQTWTTDSAAHVVSAWEWDRALEVCGWVLAPR